MMTKTRVSVCALLVLGIAAASLAASDSPSVLDSRVLEKLRGDLPEVLAGAGADELIPITIVMTEQAPGDEIAAAKQIRNIPLRRRAVVRLLKEVSDRTQRNLLIALREGQRNGSVAALIRPLWISNVIGAEVTADMVRAIAQRDDVDYINHDKPLGSEVFPVEPAGEPLTGDEIECGVSVMQAPRVWDELGITGRGVVVCSIDTGCCITHPDLENQIWVNKGEIAGNGIDDDDNGYIDDVNGWNFWERNGDITDFSGHGTHVSGTVVGDGANGIQTGMAPDAEIMNARYFVSFSGESTIWESMEYAVANGARIITVSSGWPHNQNPDRRTWREVCEASIAAGVVVMYAAGNEGGGNPPDNVRTPGDVPAVITVGATDCNDVIAGFSSRGPVTWQDVDPWRDWTYPPGKIKPTISAPGVGTDSTWNGACNTYRSLSGTSMATPHVAGAVALMLEANPALDHDDVKQILMDTSIDLGAEGMDNDYGAGRVDAYAAVQVAMSMRSIRFEYPDGRPEWIDPTGGQRMRVEVLGSDKAQPEPGTGMLHYFEDGDWVEVPMDEIEDNVYDAVFPSVPCMDDLLYFLSAETTDAETITDPFSAPDRTYSALGLLGYSDFFADDFESDQGWSVENVDLEDGAWERGVPFGSGDGAPDADFDGSGSCYVTGNRVFQDVDGGPTRLITPRLDLAGRLVTINFARYFRSGSDDRLLVEVSNDDGGSWTLVEENESDTSGWIESSFLPADFLELTANVRVRFSVADNPDNSFCEAAVDGFLIVETLCGGGGCVRDPAWVCDGDVDGDGQVNPVDSGLVQSAFGSADGQDLCNYDVDCDGQINPVDAGIVQSLFGTCDAPRDVCP